MRGNRYHRYMKNNDLERCIEIDNVQLKNCPFCNGQAVLKKLKNDEGFTIWYIQCTNWSCELTIRNDENLPKALVRKWNCRYSER